MKLCCHKCGQSVSTDVPDGTLVRAWIECPECLRNEIEDDIEMKRLPQENKRLRELVQKLRQRRSTQDERLLQAKQDAAHAYHIALAYTSEKISQAKAVCTEILNQRTDDGILRIFEILSSEKS